MAFPNRHFPVVKERIDPTTGDLVKRLLPILLKHLPTQTLSNQILHKTSLLKPSLPNSISSVFLLPFSTCWQKEKGCCTVVPPLTFCQGQRNSEKEKITLHWHHHHKPSTTTTTHNKHITTTNFQSHNMTK